MPQFKQIAKIRKKYLDRKQLSLSHKFNCLGLPGLPVIALPTARGSKGRLLMSLSSQERITVIYYVPPPKKPCVDIKCSSAYVYEAERKCKV